MEFQNSSSGRWHVDSALRVQPHPVAANSTLNNPLRTIRGAQAPGEFGRRTNSSSPIETITACQMMCRVLGVAPSGYYEWLQQPISNRAQEDARLMRALATQHGVGDRHHLHSDVFSKGRRLTTVSPNMVVRGALQEKGTD